MFLGLGVFSDEARRKAGVLVGHGPGTASESQLGRVGAAGFSEHDWSCMLSGNANYHQVHVVSGGGADETH